MLKQGLLFVVLLSHNGCWCRLVYSRLGQRLGDPVKAVIEHKNELWGSCLQIYTDVSSDQTTEKVAFSLFFFDLQIGQGSRFHDQLSVYTAELLAIWALWWIEET